MYALLLILIIGAVVYLLIEVAALRRRVNELESSIVQAPRQAESLTPPLQPAPEPEAQTWADEPEFEEWADDSVTIAETPKAHVSPQPPEAARPSAVEKLAWAAFAAAKNWLLGGNIAVRIGLVLLFMGLAWLLKYASERYAPPVEFRYIGVAVAALVLLVLGWRLRLKKPSYALLLQGGGIGVLYLTTFAALRLHALLPPEGALAIMVLLTAAAVALALLQDAMGLACAAVLGGFAAPILIATGGAHHVALFSYFALLDTGIALIAWFKAWRLLNLIGFIGTFSIVGAFSVMGKLGLMRDFAPHEVVRYYTPDKFASTEPFLILFLLMFVMIGLFFARRKLMAQPEKNEKFSIAPWSETGADYLDGTLAFGPPLVGFGLQCLVISHIEFGMAFSALALGLFYLVLAFCLRGRPAIRMMPQVYLALGVVFGTLAIPLAFDAQWTSAAWALEGAGVYWAGHMRRHQLAKAFSLALILVAAILYLKDIAFNFASHEPILLGSPMGAALLAVACLFCFYIRRPAAKDTIEKRERITNSVLAVAGLAFLYLIAPLVFGRDGVVIAWALAGMATLFAGARLTSRVFIICAFVVQALAGLLFLASLKIGQDFSLVSGWMGVFRAALIGTALTASALFLARSDAQQDEAPPKALMTIPVWAGLFFINLAFLFVLDWGQVGMAWAASGLLILWLGLWRRIPALFYFGIALEAAAGFAFMSNHVAEFVPTNGWIAAVLALAAFAGAWRLHRAASDADSDHQNQMASPAPLRLGVLSNLLLLWGVGWWVWCVADRVMFYLGDAIGLEFFHWGLLVLSLSAALWMALARPLKWPSLAHASLLPLAVAAFVLAKYGVSLHWLVGMTWAAFFLVHLLTLRLLSNLLFDKVERVAHVLGLWLGILVLMLATIEIFDHFMPDEQGSAWRWLAWALVPSLYLWSAARDRARFWPVAAFAREYRLYAALPVMAAMMIWLWIANLVSDGACAPLPYIPLFNPLELGLLLVLFACWRWCLFWTPEAGESWKALRQAVTITACLSIVAVATLAVCRMAHAWAGLPFDPSSMTSSMGVQAGWSIVWALVALVLMVGGSIRKNRLLWLAGAVLTAVVLLKLFFIELRDHGGLARIISFLGVSVLLFIVGYFAPMPQKKTEEPEQKQTIT